MAGLMEKIRQFFTLEEEVLSSEELSESASLVMDPVPSSASPAVRGRPRGTLISLPTQRKQEVVILEPGSFAEARDIAEALKAKKCILLNMRRTDKELARRIVDFLSGISYAIDGYSQKVADQIYLFTPSHIEILIPDKSVDAALGSDSAGPPAPSDRPRAVNEGP